MRTNLFFRAFLGCLVLFLGLPLSDTQAQCYPELTSFVPSHSWDGYAGSSTIPPIPYCTPVEIAFEICNTSCSNETDLTIQFLYFDNSFTNVEGPLGFSDAGTAIHPNGFLAQNFEANISLAQGECYSGTIAGQAQPIEAGRISLIFRTFFEGQDPFLSTSDGTSFVGDLYVGVQGSENISTLIDNSTIPSSDDVCTPNPSSQNYFEEKIIIDGELIIDEDYCFNDEPNYSTIPEFIMGEGAKVRILDGAVLTLNGITVEPCSKMWESIIIESGGTLIANNTTFTGGLHAITAKGGSTLSLTDCLFRDNYIGVYVPEASNFVQLVDVDYFIGNTFEGTGSLPEPYDGQTIITGNTPVAGVVLHDVVGFDIAGTAVPDPNGVHYNRFRNMANGIIATKSSLTISGSLFEDLDRYGIKISTKGLFYASTLHCTGLGDGPDATPTFRNCGSAAISLTKSNADIQECRIDEVPKGIEIAACQNLNVNIEENFIKARQIGILARLNAPLNGSIFNNQFMVDGFSTIGNENINTTAISCYENENIQGDGWLIEQNEIDMRRGDAGIYYNGGAAATITDNIIAVITQSDKSYRYSGIQLSGTTQTTVSCNDVTGTPPSTSTNFTNSTAYYLNNAWSTTIQCNDAQNVESGFFFSGACDASSFQGNNMYHYAVGLSLDSSAIMSSQIHHGNTWEVGNNTNGHVDAFHAASLELAWGQSLFQVACPLDAPSGYNSAWCPDDVVVNGGGNPTLWISPDFKDADTYACSGSCFFSLQSPQAPTKLELNVAQGKLSNQSAASLWTLEQHLFQNLQEGIFDLSTDDGTMARFVKEQEGTDAGHLYQIQQSLSAGVSPSQLTQQVQLIKTIQASMRQLQVINLDLQKGANENQVTNLLAQKEGIRNDLAHLQEQLNTLLSKKEELFQQAVKTALNYQQQLDKETIYQQNLRTVQYIYLHTVAKGNTDFTANQVKELRNIAYQCPLTGGDAVFMARSLYSFIETPRYDDDVLCAADDKQKNARLLPTEEISTVKVYPNPVSHAVTFELDIERTTTLRIFNLLGMEVLNVSLTKGQQRHQLNIESLPEGVYTWAIDQEGKPSGKFIIQR